MQRPAVTAQANNGEARALSLGCKCLECPFRGQIPVFAEGPKNPRLVVVGEGPGKNEEREGRPFVGESGDLLNRTFSRIGVPRALCHITNVTLCRPPYKPSVQEWKAARAACAPRLHVELNALRGGKTILALGAQAQSALTGKNGIFDWMGAPLPAIEPIKKYTVISTLHPAHVLRPDGRAYTLVFLIHVARAWQHTYGQLPEWKWPRIIIEPNEDALRELQRIARERPPIGFDVETRGKDPRSAPLMALSIAYSKVAISVPWERYVAKGGELVKAIEDHPLGRKIVAVVRKIMEDPKIEKVLQNGQHDLLSCERLGWEPQGYAFDTLYAHQTVFIGTRHDLGFIAAVEFPADRWKSEFHVSSDSKGLDAFVKRNPRVLRTYNAKDASMTLSLRAPLEYRLKQANNGEAIYAGHFRRAKIALDMRRRGVHIDVSKFARHRKRIASQRLKATRDLFAVARRFGWKAPPRKHPQWKPLSQEIAKAKRTIRMLNARLEAQPDNPLVPKWKRRRHQARKARKAAETARTLLVKDPKLLFNPDSKVVLHKLFFEQLHVVPHVFSEKTGGPSLNEDALQSLVTHSNSLIAAASRALLRFRRWSKLLSTYIDGMPMDENNVAHPTWNVAGARTQRWSSQDPNVMNIPKPLEKRRKDGTKYVARAGLRDLFVGAPGHWAVKGDKSQLELKIIALLAGDDKLIDAYNQGLDVHAINARDLFRIPAGALVPDSQRLLAKVFVYAANYGGSPETIWKSTVIDFPHVTLLQVARMHMEWFRAHPKIVLWQNRMLKKARVDDYVESPLSGHRIYFNGNVDEKQVYNYPVQGTGADILNEEIELVYADLNETESLMFQCHDELVLSGPDPFRLVGILKNRMNRYVELNGRRLLFNADIKIGPSWGECTEVKNDKDIRRIMQHWRKKWAEDRECTKSGSASSKVG